MDRIESKHQGDLADGIFAFPDQLTALFQFQFTDIFFGRLLQVFFEKDLQG